MGTDRHGLLPPRRPHLFPNRWSSATSARPALARARRLVRKSLANFSGQIPLGGLGINPSQLWQLAN